MKQIATALALLIGIAPSAVRAEKFSVSLTRLEQNLYKVDGQNFYVMTKYCYEYAYGENAIIDTDARQVIFIGSNPTKCELNMVLQKIA